MGILNWFGKNKRPQYHPVNRLEEMLKAACLDPLERPKFLKQIFHFDLFALGSAEPGASPEGSNGDGSQSIQLVMITHEGNPTALVFTSREALDWYIAQYADQTQHHSFVGMSASALFEMLQGKAGLALNPGHDYGRWFTPGELTEIYDGADPPQGLKSQS
jgi:hypothetical protein